MSTRVRPVAEGTVVAGKLRVVRVLGAGGMGAVYEVEHEFTKHRRALKMLHAEMLSHPTVVARFLREASAAGHIGNPHIVETFDAGKLDSGEPYLVMELLEGKTLADRIAESPRIGLGEIVDIVCQACSGVEAAHAAGIVHRDLKPENIFLTQRDGATFVKLLDFGISKFDTALLGGSGVTKDGATIGTPYYMSPEQVNGDKYVDARTDVYALGVILYETASGRKPFEADALPKLSVLIHAGHAASLSTLRDDLPEGFVAAVHKAMARDKSERFASARELAAALAKFGDAALDSTMPDATGASISPPPERPPSHPSSRPRSGSGSARPPAQVRTLAEASISVAPPARATWRGARAAVAVVATLVVVGGAALFAGRSAPTPATSESRPAPPAQTTDLSLSALDPQSATSSAAAAAPPSSAPSSAPSAQASHVAAQRPSPATSVVAPPSTTASARPTRADQHGLSNTNPYAPPSHS